MSNDLEDLDRFKAASFELLSFRERGTTVPFTTSLLVNARIREAKAGQGFEMVVVNPSGGRGALILPWEALTTICSPSLFDRHLWESLGKAEDISPIGIRREAQRLAMQNLAGKHAAAAARDDERREQASQRLVRAMLLESLINSTQGSSQAAGRLAELGPEAFHKLARRAVVKSAETARVPLAEFADDLEELIELLSGAVPQIEGEDARLRQILADLVRVTDEIAKWAHKHPPESTQFHAARFVDQTARQTIECAEFVLAATDALIANIGLLAPNWKTDRDIVFDRAIRPELVLDGWGTPIALWDTAGPNQRAAAIVEIALIAPILPREAKAWLGKGGEWFDVPRRVTTAVREKSDWRSGNSLDLVARTENLVSFSPAYHNNVAPIGQVPTKTRLTRTAPRDNTDAEKHETKSQSGAVPPNVAIGSTQPASASGRRSRTRANRAIANQMEVASDEALTKIVAVVDGLGNPEMRLRILGPSLHRLKRLRPPRLVSLVRLLFLPLSGALMDTAKWEQLKGRIPRSAIKPFMDTLNPVLKPKVEIFDQQLRGKTFDDAELVGQVGRELWHIAADAGPRLRSSPFWKNAGLAPADIDTMASLALGLWQHGGEIWNAMQEAAGQGRPEVLRAALLAPAKEGRAVFSAALEAVLQRAPRPSIFAALLQDMPAQISDIFENLLMQYAGNALEELSEIDLAAGAQLSAEIGALIKALEDWHMTTRRLDAKELFAHRRVLDQYCLATYREVVSVHVIQALLAVHSGQSATLPEIEAMAKIARSLEETGKHFGAPQGYDAMQEEFHTQMENALRDHAPMAAFANEIARIREILIGRDAADRFLLRARRQGLSTK